MIWVATEDFSPEPDRHPEDEDVGRHHPLEDRRPLVDVPAVLGHVRPDAGGDLVVDRADASTSTPLRRMISIEMSISPWVCECSGLRFSVQLMNSAFRSE